jgi:hypothetical protein
VIIGASDLSAHFVLPASSPHVVAPGLANKKHRRGLNGTAQQPFRVFKIAQTACSD